MIEFRGNNTKCSKNEAMKNYNLFFLKHNLWIVIKLIDWMDWMGWRGCCTDIAKYAALGRRGRGENGRKCEESWKWILNYTSRTFPASVAPPCTTASLTTRISLNWKQFSVWNHNLLKRRPAEIKITFVQEGKFLEVMNKIYVRALLSSER